MNNITIENFPALGYACAEAFNTLCTNLTFSGEHIRKIMITSTFAHEGKSIIAMNIMRTLAKFGKTVVLVDADLRRSAIVSNYNLKFYDEYKFGLAHMLAGREAKKLQAEYQVVFQMNCNTVIEEKGFLTKRKIDKFLKSGLISCLACDAHDCHRRRYKMTKAYEVIKDTYGVRYADTLTSKLQISAYAEAFR